MAREIYLTFMGHLDKYRQCLIKSFAAVVLAFSMSYFFSDGIFAFMIAPLEQILEQDQSLIGTGVAEAFFIKIKVALVAGLFLGSPFIFYQIWQLIAPGLLGAGRKLVFPFVLSTSFFFVGGSYFCYRGVLPFAFVYFINQYRSLGVSPEIRIAEYFTFFFRMVLAFGITFELPVFTFFLVRLGLWDYRFLWRQFRYAIIVIFILAAILTPGPDVISQVLLATPLTLLYVLSMGVAYLSRIRD
ncbi:MAG: twin-arginine translocase subunit TatC [Candidatus Binatia bacterium]